ncbi:MAG: glycosyltransferase family 2 protein [Bacteroidales bacterium]|nr:glycosyltransferase family 2 protein [Bacteroidales bacterium]
MKTHISIVSPVYRGEKMVAELVQRNVEALRSITEDYEIILVNDASPDNSWQAIAQECAKNPRVKGLNLSRNFGQHNAITAGLSYAQGDWIVIMDCDLQDKPEDIPVLYRKAQEGYDYVVARRAVKHVGWWKRFSSKAFHATLDWLSGAHTDPAIGNFGIYNEKVIKSILAIPQQVRGLQTLLSIVGFKNGEVLVEQAPSARGGTSYTLHKLFAQAFNVIVARTNKPLKFAVKLGFTLSSVSFLLAVYNLLAKWIGVIQLAGYTTTIFSIWFVGGILLLMMGVLGLYIGKIFDQSKGLPIFVVSDEINTEKE